MSEISKGSGASAMHSATRSFNQNTVDRISRINNRQTDIVSTDISNSYSEAVRIQKPLSEMPEAVQIDEQIGMLWDMYATMKKELEIASRKVAPLENTLLPAESAFGNIGLHGKTKNP